MMEAILTLRRLALFAALSILMLAPCAAASQSVAETNWVAFFRSPGARTAIELARPHTNLVASAVFHATNKRRQEHNLPLFKPLAGANYAAQLQSTIMLKRGSISHDNPEHPRLKTLQDRAEAAGLKYRMIAENVATAFGRRYEGGKPFYEREVNGKKILSHTPDGPNIPSHTYASFAESLVERWMNSPGHRKNILHADAQFLGVSCLPEADRGGMVKFYCTQVFFTPRE